MAPMGLMGLTWIVSDYTVLEKEVGHCGAAARMKPDQASEGLEAGPC